jgi:hypothetical protein
LRIVALVAASLVFASVAAAEGMGAASPRARPVDPSAPVHSSFGGSVLAVAAVDPPGADTAAVEVSDSDSSGVEIVGGEPDSEAVTGPMVRTPIGSKAAKASRFDAPHWVMLRNAVFPGWGQAANGSWIKAGAVAVGEIGLAWRLFDDRRALDQLQSQVDDARAAGDDALEASLIDSYNTRLNSYTGRQWFLGAVFVYSLLDAYIDAHFRNFKAEFETDPALPGGVPPATSTRVGLRFDF